MTEDGVDELCASYTARISRLEVENAAQLAELHAISDALGTNEGHSSVDHILALKLERNDYRAALEQARFCLPPVQATIVKDALAKYAAEDPIEQARRYT